MLRIRFSRTGKVGQPSFRIVVTDKRTSVKGRYVELLGHYMPARSPEVLEVNKERVSAWISKGAIPTDSVASLLKKQGFENMDRYLEPRNKQRKKKGEEAKQAKAEKPTAPANVTTAPS